MNENLVKIFICILISIAFIVPNVVVSRNLEKINIQSPSSVDRPHVIIYVDTSGIDRLNELNTTEKAQLKKALIAHIWANFNGSVGSDNVTVTNDPDQADKANRTINIYDQTGGTIYRRAGGGSTLRLYYGRWLSKINRIQVFLRNFIRRHGSDYKTDGKWNITKLANGIGRCAAHEVAHSYSVGHNHRTKNQSKMTEGELVKSADRGTTDWHFDNHTNKTLKKNWGKPPCKSTTDYDEEALVINFEGPTDIPDDACEFASVDASFSYEGELAYFFEFGWHGVDTDDGELDGNPYFDFIYKSSMTFNPDQDAEVITFLMGNSHEVQFLLRGTPGSPWEGEWFPIHRDNVVLSDYITDPNGKQIARNVLMVWDVNDDGVPDVNVNLNSFCYGDYSNPYNGFTYELVYPNTPPDKPTTPIGETSGKTGTEYTYSFSANDPEGDQIIYYVDWGDDSDSLWFGPYDVGEVVTAKHAWEKKGTYKIKVLCMDTNFVESDWSDPLTVTMPRNRAINTSFQWFLQSHPYLFPILQKILLLYLIK